MLSSSPGKVAALVTGCLSLVIQRNWPARMAGKRPGGRSAGSPRREGKGRTAVVVLVYIGITDG